MQQKILKTNNGFVGLTLPTEKYAMYTRAIDIQYRIQLDIQECHSIYRYLCLQCWVGLEALLHLAKAEEDRNLYEEHFSTEKHMPHS